MWETFRGCSWLSQWSVRIVSFDSVALFLHPSKGKRRDVYIADACLPLTNLICVHNYAFDLLIFNTYTSTSRYYQLINIHKPCRDLCIADNKRQSNKKHMHDE